MPFFLNLGEQNVEERMYKDQLRAAGDRKPDKERETNKSSLKEISLEVAGTVIEGMDTSESRAEDVREASSSPDPQPQSTAHQHGRQGTYCFSSECHGHNVLRV